MLPEQSSSSDIHSPNIGLVFSQTATITITPSFKEITPQASIISGWNTHDGRCSPVPKQLYTYIYITTWTNPHASHGNRQDSSIFLDESPKFRSLKTWWLVCNSSENQNPKSNRWSSAFPPFKHIKLPFKTNKCYLLLLYIYMYIWLYGRYTYSHLLLKNHIKKMLSRIGWPHENWW